MLGTTTNRLHRSPHVLVGRQQIPAGRNKLLRIDFAALVNLLRSALDAGLQHLSPDHIAIALYNRVRMTTLQCFLWVERGVDAAVDPPGAAVPRHTANLVAA